MATSVLNYTAKTVNNRLIRSNITVTAGDDDMNCASFIVPVGRKLTLLVSASAVGSGTSYAKLQGSHDNLTWFTIKSVSMDSDLSGADLAAAGTCAKVHDPASGGDFPYYRLASDMAASNGSAYVACILEHE